MAYIFKPRFLVLILICLILIPGLSFPRETQISQNGRAKENFKLYPFLFDKLPGIPSPYTIDGGVEILAASTEAGKYTLIPVTVVNKPLNIKYGEYKIGKGFQLEIDSEDFPALAETGLHSETGLDGKNAITGKSVREITEDGRPNGLSGSGFMSYDEDIISVLKGDNRLVEKLCLTHPELARPLFHVWNTFLKEYETGQPGGKKNRIKYILYNGEKIFIEVKDTKRILGSLLNIGKEEFQRSLFNDEIKGTFKIKIWRDLDHGEEAFLRKEYSNLNKGQMSELLRKISHIDTGEMVPYYIMRYGFYEGHTEFRADPIAISFIFGLRSIEAIDEAFDGKLYRSLTEHFIVD